VAPIDARPRLFPGQLLAICPHDCTLGSAHGVQLPMGARFAVWPAASPRRTSLLRPLAAVVLLLVLAGVAALAYALINLHLKAASGLRAGTPYAATTQVSQSQVIPLPPPPPLPVWWHAPIYDRASFGLEAASFLLGLLRCVSLPKGLPPLCTYS
jgi:hypothetical protein